jgi:hypothetical protein
VFISLLFVSVGVVSDSVGEIISAVRIVLLDGKTISFDACLVVCVNSTDISPIMAMNRMCENMDLLYVVSLIEHIVVCKSSIKPIGVA